MDRIIVTVEGGMVTGVTGVPAGVIVEVRDYDVPEQGGPTDGNGIPWPDAQDGAGPYCEFEYDERGA